MKKTILKNYKRIIVAILAVSIFVISSFALTGCSDGGDKEFDNTYVPPVYNKTENEQKAIIILPGIIGSNLVNTETKEPIWSGGALMNNLLMVKGRLQMDNVTTFFKNFLYKDENGKSPVPIRAANMNDQYLQYGLIDEYRNLYKFFYENYGEGNTTLVNSGKEYKVVVYQYDWTKPCADSASDLEAFIEANKYKNNILVGHSMGGLVIDHYLARNSKNIEKTSKFISLGTPHYGAIDPTLLAFADLKNNLNIKDLDFIANIDSFIEDLTGLTIPELESILGVKLTSLMKPGSSFLQEKLDSLGINEKVPIEYVNTDEEGKEVVDAMGFAKDLLTSVYGMIQTMPSLYDLLPSNELLTYTDSNGNVVNSITIDGAPITYDNLINKALNAPRVKGNASVTNAINKAKANRAKLYKNNVFIANTIGNKLYTIAGEGYVKDSDSTANTLTTKFINFSSYDNDNKLYVSLDNNLTNIKRDKKYGDGMVSLTSATLNRLADNNNVFVLKNFDHIDLYTPVSIKDGTHFLPLTVPNELGNLLTKIMKKH